MSSPDNKLFDVLDTIDFSKVKLNPPLEKKAMCQHPNVDDCVYERDEEELTTLYLEEEKLETKLQLVFNSETQESVTGKLTKKQGKIRKVEARQMKRKPCDSCYFSKYGLFDDTHTSKILDPQTLYTAS